MADDPVTSKTLLAQTTYLSPYSHAGTPGPHPNGTDPYAELRRKGLATLEAMGYDPETMVEQGIVWGEDQDPYGHVMHTRFVQFLGLCSFRVMESYDQWLSQEEYEDIVKARRVVIVMKKYELNMKRQVRYPDVVIAAYRQEQIFPDRNTGISALFSLRQQAIVAEIKGEAAYVDVKTGRSVDIRTLGGGWPNVYDGFMKKSEDSKVLREKWEKEHPKTRYIKPANL